MGRGPVLRLAAAVLLGPLIGNIAAIPFAFAIDVAYRANVTGGQWKLTTPNVIYSAITGLLTGFPAGLIARRKGALIGAMAQLLLLAVFMIASIAANRDTLSAYEVHPATWVLIGLLPATVGGRVGERLPMTAIGRFLQGLGVAVFAVTGLWGFFLCLDIVTKVAGFWGLVGAIFLTPVTFIAAPLYAGFAWHNWFPFILNYGGGIVGGALMGIGAKLGGDE